MTPKTRSNCFSWQTNNVDARTAKVISILKDMKSFETPVMKVTALAMFIADKMASDQKKSGLKGANCCVVDFTTLLRRKGKYRPIIDSYIIDRDGFELYVSQSDNPVAAQVLESYKLRLKQSSLLVKRLQEKVAKLEAARVNENSLGGRALEGVNRDAQLDAMGKVASIFFDILLSTDYCKYDDTTGDVLAVSRARRVLIPASDIATYLNWRYRSPSGHKH